MKKSGFTLIELLAILVVLGVITLVAVPSAINSSKEAKERDFNQFKKSIENAAEVYVETHIDDFASLKAVSASSEKINVSTLIDEGFLDGSTIDPRDNDTIDRGSNYDICVIVKNESGELQYTFNEGVSCQ